MIKRVYSVFDVKAEQYGPPITVVHEVEARRAFQAVVNDPQTPPGQYPEDFKLVELGTFNDATGCIQSLEVPVTVGFGSSFVRKAS